MKHGEGPPSSEQFLQEGTRAALELLSTLLGRKIKRNPLEKYLIDFSPEVLAMKGFCYDDLLPDPALIGLAVQVDLNRKINLDAGSGEYLDSDGAMDENYFKHAVVQLRAVALIIKYVLHRDPVEYITEVYAEQLADMFTHSLTTPPESLRFLVADRKKDLSTVATPKSAAFEEVMHAKLREMREAADRELAKEGVHPKIATQRVNSEAEGFNQGVIKVFEDEVPKVLALEKQYGSFRRIVEILIGDIAMVA